MMDHRSSDGVMRDNCDDMCVSDITAVSLTQKKL